MLATGTPEFQEVVEQATNSRIAPIRRKTSPIDDRRDPGRDSATSQPISEGADERVDLDLFEPKRTSRSVSSSS